jgi:hypothetical protein
MAIPREYSTSNPVVRDALALIPQPVGNKIGFFVAPDFPIDAEIVDHIITAEHTLELDDLRAPDAEAKEVRFETGVVGTVSVVERALKNKMDARKIEEAGIRGVDLIATRLAMLRQDIFDAKEYRIGQLAFGAANFGASHKDITGLNFRTLDLQGWFDVTVQEALLADGNFAANSIAFGRLAWTAAKKNDTFRKWAGGVATGAAVAAAESRLTLDMFAEFLGLKPGSVLMGDFRRKIGKNATTRTIFWDENTFLAFYQQPTLSDRAFMATPVCPYGSLFSGDDPGQATAEGTLVDARTDMLSGTERLLEVGAYHRYRSYISNANLGYLANGIVST